MKTRVFFLSALAAMCLPLAAHADDMAWYGAFDLGQAHYSGVSGPVAALGGTSHMSDNDTAYRFTGGFQFNRYWGAEASYVDFGQAELDLTTTVPAGTYAAKRQVHGFVFAGTGTFPFNDSWSVFARLGGIMGHVKVAATGTGAFAAATGSQTSTDWKVTYGVGVNWTLTENWIVRGGWDQYSSLGNQNKTGENDVNVIGIGVVYRF